MERGLSGSRSFAPTEERSRVWGGGGGTFRDVNIFFSRFKVLVSSIDSKKRGVAVSGALQQRI